MAAESGRLPLNALRVFEAVATHLSFTAAAKELGVTTAAVSAQVKEVRHPSRVVSVGDQVEAAVLNIDPGSRKISLGMKQTAPNPWDMIEAKYPAGTRIEGKVKSLTDFGAFVGLEEGIDGLIHISDMSWTKHIKHPSELFKKGQKVDAVVIRIDKEKERLSLGYEQLSRDPWEEQIPNKYRVGDSITGKVSKIADFGIFIELEGGVEGLIHVSEAGLEGSAKLVHYYLNERDDSPFWRDTRTMDVPERLKQKIELFRANGTLFQDQYDIFLEASWLQVMLGQGVMPRDYHPLADSLTDEQLRDKLANTKKLKLEPMAKMPTHDQFLKMFCQGPGA